MTFNYSRSSLQQKHRAMYLPERKKAMTCTQATDSFPCYTYKSMWPILTYWLPTLLANEVFYRIEFCTVLHIIDHNIK